MEEIENSSSGHGLGFKMRIWHCARVMLDKLVERFTETR